MNEQRKISLASATPGPTSWGNITWLVNAEVVEHAEVSLGIVTINPGQSNPWHTHPNCEEIVYVLSGTCEQYAGDACVPLGPGEGLVIPRSVEHCSRNTGTDPLVVLICCSAATRETVFRDVGARY